MIVRKLITTAASAAALCFFGGIPLVAQAPGLDVLELERRAEQSFVEDDLVTASALYRQLAHRLKDADERVRVTMTVAWLEHLRSRPHEALTALIDALTLAPDHEFRPELYDQPFSDLYHRALRVAIVQRDQRAAELIERGLQAMATAELDTAKQLFSDALALGADNPSAIYNLALANLRQGHAELALTGFQKILSLYSPEATTHIEGSSVHHAVDSETRVSAMVNAGLLLNQQGLFSEALAVLEQAVAAAPEKAPAWLGLGIAKRRSGDLAGAERAFERSHTLDPNDPIAANNLALALIDQERWSDAESLLSNATLRHPHNSSIWLNLGRCHLALHNTTDAVDALEQALRSDPSNLMGRAATAATLLADLYLKSGDASRSLVFAERASSWQPDSAVAWTFQGLAHRQLGALDAAVDSFRQALRLDPRSAQTHNSLGSVLLSRGEKELARQSFERALAIDPDLEVARQNLDLLR